MTALPHVLLDDDQRAPAPPHVPVLVGLAAWVRGSAGPVGAIAVLGGLGLHAFPGIGLLPLLSLATGAAGVLLLVLAVILSTASPSAHAEPETVLSLPLDGRWSSVDDAAPGQGNHAYGQAYALGLAVAARWMPAPGDEPARARAARRLGSRPATESTTFGQPVRAVADATVVRVVDGARDHRARCSRLTRALGAVDSAVRELCGARAVLGNHVVLDLGAGRYAVCAHLQRDSVVVVAGDRVLPGDVLAAAGSSGATSEPYLHVQVMDSPNPRTAAGLPLRLVAIDPIWR